MRGCRNFSSYTIQGEFGKRGAGVETLERGMRSRRAGSAGWINEIHG